MSLPELPSLSDALDALASKGPDCTTCSWYLKRIPQEQAKFDAYVEQVRAKRGTYAALQRLIEGYGLDTSRRSFREHFQTHHDRISKQ
jgi:hypothetical protein